MERTNIGRVQGAGVFFSTSASSQTVERATITPSSISPLVGDSVIFANGDVRKIQSVQSTTISCSNVVATLIGPQGVQGPKGDDGLPIKAYIHRISSSTAQGTLSAEIISNTVSAAFNTTTLKEWLKTNGYDSESRAYPASGISSQKIVTPLTGSSVAVTENVTGIFCHTEEDADGYVTEEARFTYISYSNTGYASTSTGLLLGVQDTVAEMGYNAPVQTGV